MEKNTSSLAWLRRKYRANPPKLAFACCHRAEVGPWRRRARNRLAQLLGITRLRREEPCPVRAEVVERFDRPKYRGEKLLVRTQQDMYVPAWLLIPTRGTGPFPTLMCLHGHGMSKDITAGRPVSGAERDALKRFRADYGRRFAELGFACFCPDARGFGQRDEALGCQQLCANAVAVGYPLTGLRVWDHLRCLDYLCTRRDLDSRRIGAAGLSMGCEHAMLLAALDGRIRAAVLSCVVRDLREEVHNACHCICSYTPDLFTHFDFSDIACMIAPRPVLLQQGLSDYIPMAFVRSAERKLRACFTLLGSANGFATDYFQGGHQFNFGPASVWMQRWFASAPR
jgi:pimeloyl-ACP methyl ester carboxylesterase